MMNKINKIAKKFSELKKEQKGVLIGFVTLGDPTPEDSLKIVRTLISGEGVDIIELGLPFSDPIADGPTIQKSSERSLKSGMNPDLYFKLAKKIDEYTEIPKICLTYYNLILQRGLEKFTKNCSEAGISGLIVPDLPVEEACPLIKECHREWVDLIFLVAPTTTKERLKMILKVARGGSFIYVVSLLGVTGARESLSDEIKELKPFLRRIKKISGKIPLAVGFGISKPEHVKEILNAGADGVIVGSAFVEIIEKNLKDKEKLLEKLETFAKELKKATKKT